MRAAPQRDGWGSAQKRGAAPGMPSTSLGLCLGSAQILALRMSHKRALGHGRTWSDFCSWLTLLPCEVHSCCPSPGQAPSWAPWTLRALSSGIGTRSERDSVRWAMLGAAGEGEVGELLALLQFQDVKRDLGSKALEPQRWLPKEAGSHGRMLPRTPGPDLLAAFDSASVCIWRESCGWWRCRQNKGKATRAQACMGFESKDSREEVACNRALLNAQKCSVAGFLALQYMGGFP